MEQNKRKKNNYTPTYFHRFLHTFNGLKVLWKEVNFKVELLILLIIVGYGFWIEAHGEYPSLPITQWGLYGWIDALRSFSIQIILFFILFAAEAFNTALEYLTDFIKPEYNKQIKIIKDLGALAVLFIAVSIILSIVFIFFS